MRSRLHRLSWLALLLCSLVLAPLAVGAADAGMPDDVATAAHDCHDDGSAAGAGTAAAGHDDCLVSPTHCLIAILRLPAGPEGPAAAPQRTTTPGVVAVLPADPPGAEPPPPRL